MTAKMPTAMDLGGTPTSRIRWPSERLCSTAAKWRRVSALALGMGGALFLVSPSPAAAAASRLRIRSDFGPENGRRPERASTRYIVLHTTEGREAGSLRKLRIRGEAHYFVHRDGRVVRLLDHSRVATHAGRSMWGGRTELDDVTLGIEVSGYHEKEPTAAQYAALRELLRQLQSLYDIADQDVLTHSMVAYGAPNRFHPYDHRGRKRCGMVFARPDVRQRLGLTAAPREDPDVRAGRLRIGDRELQRLLYPTPAPALAARAARSDDPDRIGPHRTAWSIAGPSYSSPSTLYVFPDGTRARGDTIRDWGDLPTGTQVVVEHAGDAVAEDPPPAVQVAAAGEPPERGAGDDGLLLVGAPASARDLLGRVATAGTTTYLFPSGSVRTGEELDDDGEGRRLLERLPARTRILVGYRPGGRISSSRDLQGIAGRQWDFPSTYYRLPSGRMRTGVEIDAKRVPRGTLVFLRQ